jgi:ADP-ribosyl-[dinitrogen reductase] hydrolase
MMFDNSGEYRPTTDDFQIRNRALGALVGQAVGDALGARYEFGPPGEISKQFPKDSPCRHLGGGSFGWRLGEFTDDTQMAVLLGENLITRWNPVTQWELWKEWVQTAKDVGTTTRPPLVASTYKESQTRRVRNGRGNGAVMRVAPVGIKGAMKDARWTARVAREQALITHTDPRTVEAAVIMAVALAELVSGRHAFDSALRLAVQNHCDSELRTYFQELLFTDCLPLAESNGYGDICLAEAVYAIRKNTNFEDTIRYAIDGGNDTDTVACVAGALAGAWYGIQNIPARLTTPIHGFVQMNGKVERYDLEDLEALATRLVEQAWSPKSPDYNGVQRPVAIGGIYGQQVFVTNFAGARESDDNYACMSFCRTFGATDHYKYRRSFYLLDEQQEEANPAIDSVVRDAIAEINEALFLGHDILIHCHAGESRTGLIAKAWLMSAMGYSHEEAHDSLASKWKYYSPRNKAFVRYLDEFHAETLVVG